MMMIKVIFEFCRIVHVRESHSQGKSSNRQKTSLRNHDIFTNVQNML